MKQLTLFRHAKSAQANAQQSDHERHLSKRGLEDAPMMGQRLRNAACVPDSIICSTATRTRQTAELLLPALGIADVTVNYDESIYEAPVSALLSAVENTDEHSQHLMLVGHNPGIAMFASYLLPGEVGEVPTSTAISLTIDSESWKDLLNQSVSLVLYDYPKRQTAAR